MNSKELLEQASAKIEKMNDLMASIDIIEVTLSAATKPEAMIVFFEPSLGAIGISYILTDKVMESIKNNTLGEVQKVRDEKTAELEQLLGIQKVPDIPPLAKGGIVTKRKPAIINSEFEAAVQDMIESGKKEPQDKLQEDMEQLAKEVLADPVETNPAEIIQKQEIKAAPREDISLDKYPAKKAPRKKYPDGMTVETVTRMYVSEGKKASSIAVYFGLTTKEVENFITINRIRRKKPDVKERP